MSYFKSVAAKALINLLESLFLPAVLKTYADLLYPSMMMTGRGGLFSMDYNWLAFIFVSQQFLYNFSIQFYPNYLI